MFVALEWLIPANAHKSTGIFIILRKAINVIYAINIIYGWFQNPCMFWDIVVLVWLIQ